MELSLIEIVYRPSAQKPLLYTTHLPRSGILDHPGGSERYFKLAHHPSHKFLPYRFIVFAD